MKIDKSWYIKPKDPNFPISTSAGGVVIRKEKSLLKIALLKTNEFKDYSLPKGTHEQGETIKQTAIREIQEETGLQKLKSICKLGIKERFSFEKTDWKITHYFLFLTDGVSGAQNLQPDEGNLQLRWFYLDNLPPIFWPDQKELIEENREKIKRMAWSWGDGKK